MVPKTSWKYRKTYSNDPLLNLARGGVCLTYYYKSQPKNTPCACTHSVFFVMISRASTDVPEGNEKALSTRSSTVEDKTRTQCYIENSVPANTNALLVNIQLDSGELQFRSRTKWWQLWFVTLQVTLFQ